MHLDAMGTLGITHADEPWAPVTTDLVAELAAMMDRMHHDGFDVRQVIYNPGDWDQPVPRATSVAGRVVRLGAFDRQLRSTVTLVADDVDQHVTLRIPGPHGTGGR